jgi:hypothetical protein
LTLEAAAPLIAAALGLWEQAGAAATLLDHVLFTVTDLPGELLGLTVDSTVYIDVNAAGYGWFVDPTPADDSEFRVERANGMPRTGEHEAALARMDLLTVLMHEIGHAIGFDHDDSSAVTVMQETLSAGMRLVPAAGPVTLAPDASGSGLAVQTHDSERALKKRLALTDAAEVADVTAIGIAADSGKEPARASDTPARVLPGGKWRTVVEVSDHLLEHAGSLGSDIRGASISGHGRPVSPFAEVSADAGAYGTCNGTSWHEKQAALQWRDSNREIKFH